DNLPGVGEKVEQPEIAIVEARHAPELEARRIDEGAGQPHAVTVVNPARTASVRLEHHQIVAHVVAEEYRQHHDVRRVGPHLALQRDDFLRRAVTVDAKVHGLDALALEPRAIGEFAAGHRGIGLVLRHLDRFGIGIAEYRDTHDAGRLGFGIIGAAETVAIDAHVRLALAPVPAAGAGV